MAVSCRVAFVGAGPTAREHIRAFRDGVGATIAGIHSRTRARAEALAAELGIEAVCESIDELHARTRADLVVVCVSVEHTAQIAHACLAHPWTLLIEKPPGRTLREAEQLAAASAGRRALVALNRRYYASTMLVSTALGRVSGARYIRVQDQQSLDAAAAAGVPESVLGNWMYANSIHALDLMRHFARGDVESVTNIAPWHRGAQMVVAAVRFASGDLAVYEGIWRGPGPWAVAISTESVRWEMRPLESATVQSAGERIAKSIEMDDQDRRFKPGFLRQAEAAARAALGHATEGVTLDDALRSMRLIARIYGSD